VCELGTRSRVGNVDNVCGTSSNAAETTGIRRRENAVEPPRTFSEHADPAVIGATEWRKSLALAIVIHAVYNGCFVVQSYMT